MGSVYHYIYQNDNTFIWHQLAQYNVYDVSQIGYLRAILFFDIITNVIYNKSNKNTEIHMMKLKSPITPLADRVVVKKEEQGETVRSGILLPKDSGSNEHNIGTVIAVGEGRETDSGSVIKPKVSVGQKVIFSWGDKVEINGNEYHIIGESSVLGIINE